MITGSQKATWAVSWMKIRGLPKLSGSISRASREQFPSHGHLENITQDAKAIIQACNEAKKLLS